MHDRQQFCEMWVQKGLHAILRNKYGKDKNEVEIVDVLPLPGPEDTPLEEEQLSPSRPKDSKGPLPRLTTANNP